MQSTIASPVSRNDLRQFAETIREVTKTNNQYMFPVLEFLENIMPEIFPDFHLEICSTQEMGNIHGITCKDNNTIKLREDVYLGAIEGVGRDRFTCAHEISHYLLHNSSSVHHARLGPGEKVKTYLDPEWQADALAGEILMPAHLIKGKSISEISDLCGVSFKAAERQLKTI